MEGYGRWRATQQKDAQRCIGDREEWKPNQMVWMDTASLFVDDLPLDMIWIGSYSYSNSKDKKLMFLFLIRGRETVEVSLVLFGTRRWRKQ